MGKLADYYQVSDSGTLHDSTQADAGKNASAPIRADLVSDPFRYTICSNCFPKQAARQKAEAEPLPEKRTRGSRRDGTDSHVAPRSAEGNVAAKDDDAE